MNLTRASVYDLPADPTVDRDLIGRLRIHWAGQHHTLTSDELARYRADPSQARFAIASQHFREFAEWHEATLEPYD